MTRELTDQLRALRDATVDIERHVATGGWDGPIRLFALVRAQAALAKTPELAQELPADVSAQSITDPLLLFSVEQEGLPHTSSLEELLGQIVWPDDVDGAALSVERIVLPPSAENDIPADPAQALEYLRNHRDRQDVRMVVAVLREGQTWSVIRMRSHDTDAEVLSGENLVEGLTAALQATFE